MSARRVIYNGRVQGVGFRYSVKQIAAGFEVQGSVKNLPDRSVELRAMSWDKEELEAFLLAIDESDLAGFIKEKEVEEIPELEGVRGFSIVR